MINWRKPLIESGLRLSGNPAIKYLDEMRKSSHMDKDRLQAVQDKLLEKLVLHAYHHVPYYYDVFDYFGLVKNGKVYPDKFTDIPPLTKEIIRKDFDDLKSSDMNKRKWYYNASGGSTGKPLRFIQDKDYNDWNNAVKLFYMEMAGKEAGEKELKLWGSERDILEGSIGFSAKLVNFMYNRKLLNSFRMTKKDMFNYAKAWNSFRPKAVWTYIDSIHELARFADENKIALYSPQSIIVTAGTLDEDVRHYIEDVTGARVYNQYGSREVGSIACECHAQKGLHIFENFNKVEIVDGKILVTNLRNYSMPLVRYEIGDTGRMSAGKCSCRRSLKRIARVTGRITDHFRKKDGTIIHGEYFTHLFYFKDWIKKFQIVQKDYDLVEVKIVLDGAKDEKEIAQINKKIKLVMGSECLVRFTFVDGIDGAKEKYRYTMCEI